MNVDLRLHVDFFGCTPRANKCVGAVNRPIQRQPPKFHAYGVMRCRRALRAQHCTTVGDQVRRYCDPPNVSHQQVRHNVMRYSRPLAQNTVKTTSGDAVQSAPCTQHCTTSSSLHGVVGATHSTLHHKDEDHIR